MDICTFVDALSRFYSYCSYFNNNRINYKQGDKIMRIETDCTEDSCPWLSLDFDSHRTWYICEKGYSQYCGDTRSPFIEEEYDNLY